MDSSCAPAVGFQRLLAKFWESSDKPGNRSAGGAAYPMRWVIPGILSLLSAVATAADPPGPTPAPDTVTIEAERQRKVIQQQISTFVTAITIPSFDEALLRWHSPICPVTVG